MTGEQGEWFTRVSVHYTDPKRYYHDTLHLRCVLTLLQQQSRFAGYSDIPSALFFAALYHDAVYDPHRADNEEESARICVHELTGARIPAWIIARASELILSTKSHQPLDDRFDALALLDADLWILGASPNDYARYAGQIRQEYAHIPSEIFRAKRADVLDRFLARSRLYFGSGAATEKREAQARINLREEIARLRL